MNAQLRNDLMKYKSTMALVMVAVGSYPVSCGEKIAKEAVSESPSGELGPAPSKDAEEVKAEAPPGVSPQPEAEAEPRPVTKQVILDLARKSLKLKDFIDPGKGILLVNHDSGGGSDDAKETREARHLCGDAITRELPALLELLEERTDAEHTEINCSTKDSFPQCESPTQYEYDVTVTWRFEHAPDGEPKLIAVYAIEADATHDEAYHEETRAFAAKHFAEFRKKACPTP